MTKVNNLPYGVSGATASVVNNKIYIICGKTSSSISNGNVCYDVSNNSVKYVNNMPNSRAYAVSESVGNRIYVLSGRLRDYSTSAYTYNVIYNAEELTKEEIANEYVILAEKIKTLEAVSESRDYINKLDESPIKDKMQRRLSLITLNNLLMEKSNTTSNLDLYIKSENMLSMTLSTSLITFEDFNGTDDIEKLGAITVNINSSLPYSLNVFLPNEIENSSKNKTMDKKYLILKNVANLNIRLSLK